MFDFKARFLSAKTALSVRRKGERSKLTSLNYKHKTATPCCRYTECFPAIRARSTLYVTEKDIRFYLDRSDVHHSDT